MKDLWKSCLIAGTISCIVIAALFLLLPNEDRNTVNLVSIAGAVFSLAGVVIAVIQIAKVRNSSEAASAAAMEAKHDLQRVLSITEFAQIVAIIRKVKGFVRDDKFDLAIERISDIKDFLDRIHFLNSMNVESSSFSRFKNKLDMNMSDLERQLARSVSLDKETFMKDMEELISLLIQVDNTIKNS